MDHTYDFDLAVIGSGPGHRGAAGAVCRAAGLCCCRVLAFAGAWGATMLVIGISRVAGAVDAAGMLLAGVAVAAMLGALRSFLMLALSDETVSLQVVLSWVLGGIQTPSWPCSACSR